MVSDPLIDYIIPGVSEQEIAILMKEYIPYSIEEKLNHYNTLQHEVSFKHQQMEIKKELLVLQELLKEIQTEYKLSLELDKAITIKSHVKEHIDNFINDNSKSNFEKLEWINKQLQNHFLRPASVERNMIKDVPLEIKDKLIPILQKAFADEINLDVYASKIVFYGSAEESALIRIDLLKNILLKARSGLVEVFILTGARDLWPIDEKSTEILLIEQFVRQLDYTTALAKEIIAEEFARFFADIKSPKHIIEKRKEIIKHFQESYHIKWPTETDMIKRLINADKYFNQWKIHYIDAPKKPDGGRPDTYDTLIEWWQEYGADLTKGDDFEIYGISSQPVALYQLEKFRSFAFNYHLPDYIKFDIIAHEIDLRRDKYFSSSLDSLARIIYSARERT